jgi:hypothetical protein
MSVTEGSGFVDFPEGIGETGGVYGAGVTITDGVNNFFTDEINFNSVQFYISTDLDGDGVVNLLNDGFTVTDGTLTFDEQHKITFRPANFYLTTETDGSPVVNLNDPEITFDDGINHHTSDKLNFNDKQFYLSTDIAGKPVANLSIRENTIIQGTLVVSNNLQTNGDFTVKDEGSATSSITINSTFNATPTCQVQFANNNAPQWSIRNQGNDSNKFKYKDLTTNNDIWTFEQGVDTDMVYIDANSNIEIGGSGTPPASAKLSVTSISGGFLPPRMSASDKNSITSPADGLMVYQTDGPTGKKVQIAQGGIWFYLQLESN